MSKGVPREWGEGNHLRGGNWSGNGDGKNQCHPSRGVSLILPISRPKPPADINESSNVYEYLAATINRRQDTRRYNSIWSNSYTRLKRMVGMLLSSPLRVTKVRQIRQQKRLALKKVILVRMMELL